MIKRIICPTDFSTAANNATEYAARVAQVLNANLFLVHVERARAPMAGASMAGITDDEEKTRINAQLKQLETIAADVSRTYNIVCDHELDITSQSFAKTIARMTNDNTMIVMGTNGVDNLYQFYFGTNSYNVIQEANCPVLIIPEQTTYTTFHQVLYAFTYETKGRRALGSLCDFMKFYEKAQITFLHVSKNDTDISQDVYNGMKDEVEEFCIGKIAPSFSRVYAEHPSDGIDEYMRENKTDLLIMVAHHRTMFESLFQPKPLLDEISAVSKVPLLVLHA